MNQVTAQEIIYKIAGKPPLGSLEECESYKCFLCGESINEGVPVKQAIKKTFTNLDLAKKPQASHVCAACVYSLSENLSPEIMGRLDKEKPQAVRCYSHAAINGKWKTFSKKQKEEMRSIICNPPGGHWFLCVSETSKKHILFRTPVNQSTDNYYIQFEEQSVLAIRTKVVQDLLIADRVYSSSGLNKVTATIQESRYSPWSNPQFVKEFEYLKALKNSPYLRLLIFFARKEENPYGTETA